MYPAAILVGEALRTRRRSDTNTVR
jgi:hypothetical protein